MILRSVIILAVALAACKGKQPVVTPVETDVNTEAARPDWVRARPASSMYYIGVGLASKSRPDHLETAKKNALNDLASEISVTVEGNSLLYTLDQRSHFDESFTGTIKTSTQEQIEGFEMVDSWESPTEYWTYYRLSRSEHARVKAEKKAQAIGTALDLHARSRESLASGDLKSAFDQDLRAILAMKNYWGENDVVQLDGKQVPLVNELYNDLQKLTSGVRFAILPERCELSYANRFKREMLISATYSNGTATRDLVQLPVAIEFPGLSGKVIEQKNTDHEGHVRANVQGVDPEAAAKEVVVRLDLRALVSKELDPTLVKALMSSLTVPEQRAAIDLRMPKVFMRSVETNLGVPVRDAGLSVVVREELTRKGFRFVEREADSDMVLQLNASTRQGGEASGFFTAFLDVSYSFRDRLTQDVLHEGGRQGVKGVQLNYEKAGLEAYKKAVPDIRKDLLPAMMSALQ